MKVFETLHDRYADLASAGFVLGDEYDKLLDKYQSDWNQGCRWCFENAMDMFNPDMSKRTEDSEQEITVCIDELASVLEGKLLNNWAKRYNRDQVLNMLNMLGEMDCNGTLQMWGTEIRYHEIANAWNKTHADETPLRQNSGISI